MEAQLTLVPTLVEGVFQLCPGQKVIVAPSGVVQSAISLPPESTDPRAVLESSVKQQSISDVEVGVQLSGGIDSSLVAYEYAKHNGSVHGFYVSIDDRKCCEDRWARRAADLLCKRFRFQLHTIPATREEVARVLPSVAWSMDEPAVRHPNAAGVYLLCEYVRKRTPVRVLLMGEAPTKCSVVTPGTMAARSATSTSPCGCSTSEAVPTLTPSWCGARICPLWPGSCTTIATCTCLPFFFGRTA